MLNYTKQLFDTVVDERLVSVGTKVWINGHQLLGAMNTGEFGGDPNRIDASTLLDKIDQSVLGRQSQGLWQVEYIYNDADFSAMETAAALGTSVLVKVEIKNGATFENTGTVSNRMNGVGDNATLTATVSVAIDGGSWVYTAPSSTPAITPTEP